MADDPWVGKWPGRRATYVIEPGGDDGDGYAFILDAEDADGQAVKAVYGGPVDGVGRALPGDGGYELVLTRLSSHSIESTLKRDGAVLDRWVRELAPDGATIRFTQFRFGPDGREYRNCSVYRKAQP